MYDRRESTVSEDDLLSIVADVVEIVEIGKYGDKHQVHRLM